LVILPFYLIVFHFSLLSTFSGFIYYASGLVT
jgi:hypothetical protein